MQQLAGASGELVGRVLGEFEVVELLDRGGQGAVYRAEQRGLGREVAVKVASQQHGGKDNDASITRFLRETQLAARLDHPYAAHIYASGAEPDGLLWVAMELVRGRSLGDYLDLRGPITLDRFIPLLERIAEVVHTAHEQGIVHRDLKPDNVMILTRAGRLLPKLVDFGIARAITAGSAIAAADLSQPAQDPMQFGAPATVTRTGVLVGSPAYMAPEQWYDPSSVGPAADIYSLTALSFQALTGELPFREGSVMAMAKAHAKRGVPALGERFPPALDAVLARGMAKKAKDRYGSALELAAAFREAAGAAAPREAIPTLDQALRDALIADAPQPIAEAAATLDAARSTDEAWHAMWNLLDATATWLGIVALACRARTGTGGTAPRDDGDDAALEAARAGVLDASAWIALARAICRPFAERAEVFPLPELVEALAPGGAAAEPLANLAELRGALSDGGGDDAGDRRRELVGRGLDQLARFLRAVRFVLDYPLIIPRGGVWERWTGTRRSPRPAIDHGAAILPDGEAVLVDAEATPVVTLAPLVQVAPPAPGAGEELFLFAGRGRRGATLRALPAGFELPDDHLFTWYAANIAPTAGGEAAAGTGGEHSPYLGLSTFAPEDASNFFGREQEVASFLNRMRVQPLLVVVGPSGTGKSSFVQAGVVPSLPLGWKTITVRPGPSPLAALQARLDHEGIAARVRESTGALGDALRRAGPTVLVIDQLEELFTLCHDPDERHRYASALVAAASAAADPVRVILTLRDDFLVRAEQLAALRNRITPGLTILATPAREDLLRILGEPARRAGYGFDDPAVPDEMVDAVADQPGALALLSFTASQLWELRDRQIKQLTRRAYDGMGGVGGALAKHAEDTLAAMTPAEHGLVREAFRHLVTSEGTRAVLTRAELGQVLRGGDTADRVIEKLVAARLCVSQEADSGADRVEVIHETLLEAWPRLVGWRREDAENARLRDQLRAAARQWEERGRPGGLLWRDDALTEYRLWRARYPGALTDAEEAFAGASLADAARGRRRRRTVLAVAFAALAVGLAVMGLLRVRAVRSADEARARLVQSYTEQGRQALVSGQAMEALVYLTRVRQMEPGSPTLHTMLGFAATPLRALARSLPADPGKVWSAQLSPDDRRVLTAGDDHTAKIWDGDSGRLIATLAGHTLPVYAAAYSPDGARIVTASFDGTARLWTAEGAPIATMKVAESETDVAAWSADSRRIVTAGGDGLAQIWDATGALLHTLTGHEYAIVDAAFDPAGHRVVTAGVDATARIWDADTGAELAKLAHDADVTSASWSPDGARVVTASWDGKARIWDAATGRLVATLTGHGDKLDHAAYSPDGTRIATAGRDGTARIWDATTGDLVHVLRGHHGRVGQVEWDRTSTRVTTASDDRSARVWDATTGRMLASLEGHAHVVTESRFSADGTRIVTASYDGTAKLWRASDAYLVARWEPIEGQCHNGEVSERGRFVGVSCSGTTRVIELATRRLIALPPSEQVSFDPGETRAITVGGGALVEWALPGGTELRALAIAGSPIVAAAWSPDGTRIAAAAEDGRFAVWDAATGAAILERKELASTPIALQFVADGRVVTGDATTIHVLALDPPRAVITIAVPEPALTWIAASVHGVVGGNLTPEIRMWRLDRAAPPVDLHGHAERVLSASFDRTGTRLGTASGDNTARLWAVPGGQPLATLAGSPQFLGDVSFDPAGAVTTTIGGDGVVRFWDPVTAKLFYELPAHQAFGLFARYTGAHHAVSVGWNGEIDLWSIPFEAELAPLEQLVQCCSALELDAATGGLRPRSSPHM